MYIYDIKLPNNNQYSLHYGKNENECLRCSPLNVSQKVSYLKSKIKSHRDISDTNEEACYIILTPKKEVVFIKNYSKGEKGNGTSPYSKCPETVQEYKAVFLYMHNDELTTELRKSELPLTYYEALCYGGKIITDLKLLKILSDHLHYGSFPIMVPKSLLVQIATYFPTNEEEFLELKGAGPKIYSAYGIYAVQIVEDYFRQR